MARHFTTAALMTVVTTVLLGIAYPLAVTGLAQVRGFRGETRDIEQMIQRVDSDIEYINNWSVWLDFIILVRTLFAFTGKQAY